VDEAADLLSTLYLLIVQQWVQTLSGPYDWGSWPLGRYVFSESFLRKLEGQADLDDVTWACSMVACGLAREFYELELEPRGKEPQGRTREVRGDGAEAYRCSILSGRGAGGRLDFWILQSGVIEFDSFTAIHPNAPSARHENRCETRDSRMLIAGLELAPATRAAWLAVGIRDTDGLRQPAVVLLELPGITGSILYETVCQLNEHHLGLPARASAARIMAPTTNDLEMLRLRVVDGATLKEIGIVSKLSRERVRQRLHQQFGLTGEPPAAMERRRDRLQARAETEQMIALRLLKREQGMPLSHLFSGFKTRAANVRARAAPSRLEARGYLVVESEVVKPTAALLENDRK
jgi:hypothetical protein